MHCSQFPQTKRWRAWDTQRHTRVSYLSVNFCVTETCRNARCSERWKKRPYTQIHKHKNPRGKPQEVCLDSKVNIRQGKQIHKYIDVYVTRRVIMRRPQQQKLYRDPTRKYTGARSSVVGWGATSQAGKKLYRGSTCKYTGARSSVVGWGATLQAGRKLYRGPTCKYTGARSSVVGWGATLQSGRPRVRFPDEVIRFLNIPNPSGRTRPLGTLSL
jgi:hypothetical protein